MPRLWMALGALSGLVAVAMAAYASHGIDPARGGLAMTGASLQAWHALALLGAGLLAERRRGPLPHVAAGLFTLGSALFCIGVYLRAFTEHSIGLATPVGGVALTGADAPTAISMLD